MSNELFEYCISVYEKAIETCNKLESVENIRTYCRMNNIQFGICNLIIESNFAYEESDITLMYNHVQDSRLFICSTPFSIYRNYGTKEEIIETFIIRLNILKQEYESISNTK